MKKLLTIKEAAELLKVNTETLRRWDNQGKLKAVRIGSRKGVGDRRYRQEDIKKYLKENS
ncbi:MAG: helix-turn-helix domain-containing protein [Candidatus Woesebacteria bacterium]|jgi:excisionase family DNA binding protein